MRVEGLGSNGWKTSGSAAGGCGQTRQEPVRHSFVGAMPLRAMALSSMLFRAVLRCPSIYAYRKRGDRISIYVLGLMDLRSIGQAPSDFDCLLEALGCDVHVAQEGANLLHMPILGPTGGFRVLGFGCGVSARFRAETLMLVLPK